MKNSERRKGLNVTDSPEKRFSDVCTCDAYFINDTVMPLSRENLLSVLNAEDCNYISARQSVVYAVYNEDENGEPSQADMVVPRSA